MELAPSSVWSVGSSRSSVGSGSVGVASVGVVAGVGQGGGQHLGLLAGGRGQESGESDLSNQTVRREERGEEKRTYKYLHYCRLSCVMLNGICWSQPSISVFILEIIPRPAQSAVQSSD